MALSALLNRSNSNNNNNGNGSTELIVAAAALAISAVALICAVFQALNQYFGTATGLTSCKSQVIGDWAEFTRWHWRIRQFRIEVQFRVPVIFVAPPKNKRGPLGQKTIYYVDGTKESCEKTHTWTVEEFDHHQDARRDAGDTREAIRTADSELVSWAALLMAAQRMERESNEWQRCIFATYSPLTQSPSDRGHTMAIGIQEQTRSWDTMPSSLRKPYATTAICHLIEIMAMLGVYWKEFDMSSNKYRAQGNGFQLTGAVVEGLGLAFTFNKTGKTWFQEHRIVPKDSVKQLCFGFCPTIFRGRLKTTLYTDEPKDERTLQLASHAEVAEMLVSFGCNTNTVNYFRLHNEREHIRYSHLFPIPFEMLGMVGELLQIKQTAFTMLPNPTFFTWNKSAFSLPRLLENFNETISQFGPGTTGPASAHISKITSAAKLVLEAAAEEEESLRQHNELKHNRRLIEEARNIQHVQLDSKTPTKTGDDDELDEASFMEKLHSRGSKVATWFRGIFSWVLKIIGQFLLAVGVSAGRNLLPKKKALAPRRLVLDVEERPSFKRYLETLHKAIEDCDAFLGHNHPLVKHVFVLHLQEVMAYLNEPPDTPSSHPAEGIHSSGPTGSARARAHDRQTRRPSVAEPAAGPSSTTAVSADTVAEEAEEEPSAPAGYVPLHVIDTASWVDRHEQLMQLYGLYIRDRVRNAPIPAHLKEYQQVKENEGAQTGRARASLLTAVQPDAADEARDSSSQDTVAASANSIELDRWQNTTPVAGAVRSRSGQTTAAATLSTDSARTTSHQPTASLKVDVAEAAAGRRAALGQALPTIKRTTTAQDIDDIWCTLTFRMLCWLMLHDFHRKDVQVSSKSDTYDSRMPVYLL